MIDFYGIGDSEYKLQEIIIGLSTNFMNSPILYEDENLS